MNSRFNYQVFALFFLKNPLKHNSGIWAHILTSLRVSWWLISRSALCVDVLANFCLLVEWWNICFGLLLITRFVFLKVVWFSSYEELDENDSQFTE
jgi:hypothetical protein